MEWNNGTIFRVFINSLDQTEIDCKVDIAQQELNNTVFIGIENFVLRPNVGQVLNDPVTIALQDYWAKTKYIQLESVQLTPYIDFSSQNSGGGNLNQAAVDFNRQNSRNTSVFARLPLIASPTLGNAQLTTEATFAGDRVLNKDSILYEMRNNPHALSNGRLRFRLLDEDGQWLGNLVDPTTGLPVIPADPNGITESPIKGFAFTLVIYKPSNSYN